MTKDADPPSGIMAGVIWALIGPEVKNGAIPSHARNNTIGGTTAQINANRP
jgi:hypothetical protein